jgi:hypothetical protein
MTGSRQRETSGPTAAPRAAHPWVTAGYDRIRFGVGQIIPPCLHAGKCSIGQKSVHA